jgi:hypothetical protein
MSPGPPAYEVRLDHNSFYVSSGGSQKCYFNDFSFRPILRATFIVNHEGIFLLFVIIKLKMIFCSFKEALSTTYQRMIGIPRNFDALKHSGFFVYNCFIVNSLMTCCSMCIICLTC